MNISRRCVRFIFPVTPDATTLQPPYRNTGVICHCPSVNQSQRSTVQVASAVVLCRSRPLADTIFGVYVGQEGNSRQSAFAAPAYNRRVMHSNIVKAGCFRSAIAVLP